MSAETWTGPAVAPRGQALVIGASSEIGRAVAVDLAALGHDCTLWGRDPERLDAAAAACRAVGAAGRLRTTTDRVDVTDLAAVTTAVDRVRRRGPLTVVVWSVGLFDWAPADEADAATWARIVEVGLGAAAATTTLVLPLLLAAAPSALVYIGSGASRTAYANNAAHVATKHGLAGLAGGVWLDVRDRGVKVSLVSPGMVAAGPSLGSPAGREHPERLLQPADVASAVRFVVTFPGTGCPVEVSLQPQRTP